MFFNIAATPQPDGGNGRWHGLRERLREVWRRMPERVQLRLELLRGRKLDLNLQRSRTVRFKVRRDRDDEDEDDVDVPQQQQQQQQQRRRRRRGNRVFIGERGRVVGWRESENEVNTLLILAYNSSVT